MALHSVDGYCVNNSRDFLIIILVPPRLGLVNNFYYIILVCNYFIIFPIFFIIVYSIFFFTFKTHCNQENICTVGFTWSFVRTK